MFAAQYYCSNFDHLYVRRGLNLSSSVLVSAVGVNWHKLSFNVRHFLIIASSEFWRYLKTGKFDTLTFSRLWHNKDSGRMIFLDENLPWVPTEFFLKEILLIIISRGGKARRRNDQCSVWHSVCSWLQIPCAGVMGTAAVRDESSYGITGSRAALCPHFLT